MCVCEFNFNISRFEIYPHAGNYSVLCSISQSWWLLYKLDFTKKLRYQLTTLRLIILMSE